MYRIELLPHIADVRLKLVADTVEELFQAGTESMANFLVEGACADLSGFQIERIIHTSSLDTTTLLVDFLSDVLTATYHDKAIFCRIEVLQSSENSIHARIFGKKVPQFEDDIKAVTYHEAEVHKNEEGRWQTLLIYDI